MLEQVPIFSGLETSELAEIERQLVKRSFAKHTVILTEGDSSDSLYIILRGKVKVYLNDAQGKEAIINYQGAGEYFGELALIDDSARSASVMTLEKSEFAVISKAAFNGVMEKNPQIAIHLLKDLARRVRILTDEVKSLALSDVYGRLSKTLLGLASERDGTLMIEGHITQQELANRIGASREMVCRIIKDLVIGGYVSLEQNRYLIHKPLPPRY
jgi:CRP/FNR family cyclic AMP-dependent transcriptional regulator